MSLVSGKSANTSWMCSKPSSRKSARGGPQRGRVAREDRRLGIDPVSGQAPRLRAVAPQEALSARSSA